MALIGTAGGGGLRMAGRASEVLSMEKVLNDARSGSAGAVVVLGEPGIGKTRLLGELCERAAAAGFDVMTSRGSELEIDVPFGLVVDALDERFMTLDTPVTTGLGPDRLAELAAVLPSLAGRGGQPARRLEVERFEFHRAVRATFEQLVRQRPLVLALDDVHWADPASTELVAHLLRRLVPGMVLALAYRSRQAPRLLYDAVARATRDNLLCELELTPLTIREAAEAVGQRPESPIVRALHSESGGNPFYLEQLARSARKGLPTRMPDQTVGIARETDTPTAVRMTIAQELTALAGDTLRVLQAGAVAGDPFDAALVTAIVDTDETRVLECLDELVAVELVRSTTTPGQFRFRHPIVRRVVYDDALPGWRFGAHKQAARALAQRGAPLGVRAHHVEQSASPGDEDAVATLTEAGQAVAPRAPAAAARWFEAALRLLPATSGVERRLPLVVMLAGALASAGHLRDSRAKLEHALELLPVDSLGDRVRIIGMIARADHGLGRAEDAHHLIVATLGHAIAGSADAITLELELASSHLMRGQWEQAVATAAHACAQAEALGDRALQLAARSCLALFAADRGDVAAAQRLVRLVADGLDGSDVMLAPELLEPLANLVYTEISIDHFRAAGRHAERGLNISRATGHGHVVARFILGSTSTKLMLGQLGAARRSAESAVETALLLDNDQLRSQTQAVRCWVETQHGDLPAALAAGRAAVQAADRRPRALYAWLAHACYGEALIEAGEFERGRHEILSLGGPELSGMSPTSRPVWYQALVTAELMADRIDAAEAITRRIEDSAEGLRSREAQAFLARARIHTARGDYRAAAAAARQAHERFDAAEMRVWVGRARLTAGRALARADELPTAVRELELAHSIFRDAGAARLGDEAAKALRTLGRRVTRRPTIDEPESPAVLTERERGVADLVAKGYSNRDIAAELFISPKTVEKHLTKIYVKVGASSRAGLAAAMHRRHECPGDEA
ncbi:AAA family ATPase [Nocardia sp. NPDC049220]|uniref:helix-turn-helix transcriptional regulator n=1 Tax=Nocardia sp. NPDC049220 TaxID=3155273 RepID=UPI0033EA4D35